MGLTLMGLTLTVFGLSGWSKRQKVQDRRDDIELDKLSVEFTRLTQEEKEEKAETEANDLVQEQGVDHEASAVVAPTNDSISSTGEQPREDPLPKINHQADQSTGQASQNAPFERRQVTVRELRDKMLAFEIELTRKLSTIFKSDEIFAGVRIGRTNGPALEADVYVRPAMSHDAYAFEVKYVDPKVSPRPVIARALTKLALVADSLNGMRNNANRDVIPVLVLITKGDPKILDDAILTEVAAAQKLLPRLPVALRYREDVFQNLTGPEMMEGIRTGLKNLP
ncbi:hypothetical protein [Saccharothrix obliqua]|uniref:hypothetical protein n=1 Tax=Saccharothrix obliqua TaxID=2861747 RepID=UPI001C5CED51|nr:hypothetical protein [Saccharothrix obliqua]MBW4717408.1 hypothetical protein [Saccharothrix obliqua]